MHTHCVNISDDSIPDIFQCLECVYEVQTKCFVTVSIIHLVFHNIPLFTVYVCVFFKKGTVILLQLLCMGCMISSICAKLHNFA